VLKQDTSLLRFLQQAASFIELSGGAKSGDRSSRP